jgi:hypothetical protein
MAFRYAYTRTQDNADEWGEQAGQSGGSGPGGDVFFTFTQTVASATWNVRHNLGKCPAVSVVDSSGHQVIGDVSYENLDSLTILFSAPFAGAAYLN